MNNFSLKKTASEYGSEQNSKPLNLSLKPTTTQVPHFSLRFRKQESAKPFLSCSLSYFIAVQKIAKNDLKRSRFRNSAKPLFTKPHHVFAGLGSLYPPYTMGVKIPP